MSVLLLATVTIIFLITQKTSFFELSRKSATLFRSQMVESSFNIILFFISAGYDDLTIFPQPHLFRHLLRLFMKQKQEISN